MADEAATGDIELEVVPPEGSEPEDETIILIGDEDAPPASDEENGTQLVRDLRKRLKDEAAQRRADNAELARLRAQVTPPATALDPGPKPTMEDSDWDADIFEKKLDAWKEAQAKASTAQAEAKRKQEADQADWQTDVARYEEAKKSLRIADYEDAEAAVVAALSPVQQMALVKASANTAVVIAALGKSRDRLADLAKIADPIKFAVAVAKLEGTLKVTTAKRPPAPETIVRGGASIAPKADKHLERLEAEFQRTGDRSKVTAYLRSLKAKS